MSLRTLGLLLLIAASVAHADPPTTTYTLAYKNVPGQVRYYTGKGKGHEDFQNISSEVSFLRKTLVKACGDTSNTIALYERTSYKIGTTAPHLIEETTTLALNRLGVGTMQVPDFARILHDKVTDKTIINSPEYKKSQEYYDSNAINIVLPDHPVKVGDKWTASQHALQKMPGLPLLEGELKLTFTLVEAQQVDGQTYLRINSEGEGQMESPEPSTVRGVAVSMFFEIDHQATTVFCLEAGETQLSTIQDSVRFEATAVNATTGKRVTTTVTITDNATLEKVDKPPK